MVRSGFEMHDAAMTGEREACLDDSSAMRSEIKGSHIELLSPPLSTDSASLPSSLIISVKLIDGMRPVRLKLDSGSNVPFLYNISGYMALGLVRNASFHGGENGTLRTFTALPPQTMKIGSVEVPHVTFVTLENARKDTHTSDFDGLLTLGLFRRVFIDHADRFVVLDPW
jgi:hypothetical protein